MRSGIALLITLSVIAVMLVSVGVIFAYLEKSKNEATYMSALVQASLLFRDGKESIEGLLKNVSQDKELKKNILDTLYFAPITMQAEEDKERFATLNCTPLENGININWLGLENNSSEESQNLYRMAQLVFDRLSEQHDIIDSAALLMKIKNAVGNTVETKEISQAFIEQTKGIISLSQLQSIAREYQFESDDMNTEKIEWGKYFSFDQNSTSMDAGYLSPELISLLFDIELDMVQNDWMAGDELQPFIASHGGDLSLYQEKIFQAHPAERMRCRIQYGHQGGIYAMGFNYLEGKAEKFEFYGKQ